MDITFDIDLKRYTDNQLYNMLTSGVITREEYRAEIATRMEQERKGETL